MSAEDDLARFGGMSAEVLIARLRAAEDVCVLYSWTASTAHQSDREKALHELWSKWYNLVGPAACEPAKNPHLTDEVISDLARQRDATREATLRHFFGDEAVE
jgi:hypothetical protein